MIRVFLALAALLVLGRAQAADDMVPAHPSLWTVHGKHCTVFLFGSIHLLSPKIAWRDARIDTAIHSADTFFFETALDADKVKQIVAAKGSLPQGQSLRALLPPQSQKDLDDDMASLGVPEAGIDARRPWLATLALTAIKYAKDGLSPTAGVDVAIMGEAQTRGKPLRYLETIEQQMALLAPDDPKLELEAFEAFLKDFKTEQDDIAALTDAWAAGDQKKLDTLITGELVKYPAAKKALFDDRNAAWEKTLRTVLDKESGTFLVTVGAGHLLGDTGVPALLRRDGYVVEGP
jgi:uncharacterized protein